MRPLVSRVFEHRLLALGELVIGLVLMTFALCLDAPGKAVADAALTAGGFAGMWFFGIRRLIRDSVKETRPAPIHERESHVRTALRVLSMTLGWLLVLLLGLAVVLDEPGLVAGTALGMFGLRLAAMRWLRRWELDHEVRLLREPLWRWTRTGPKGSRRGQRPSDPHGYYVEAQAVRR